MPCVRRRIVRFLNSLILQLHACTTIYQGDSSKLEKGDGARVEHVTGREQMNFSYLNLPTIYRNFWKATRICDLVLLDPVHDSFVVYETVLACEWERDSYTLRLGECPNTPVPRRYENQAGICYLHTDQGMGCSPVQFSSVQRNVSIHGCDGTPLRAECKNGTDKSHNVLLVDNLFTHALSGHVLVLLFVILVNLSLPVNWYISYITFLYCLRYYTQLWSFKFAQDTPWKGNAQWITNLTAGS